LSLHVTESTAVTACNLRHRPSVLGEVSYYRLLTDCGEFSATNHPDFFYQTCQPVVLTAELAAGNVVRESMSAIGATIGSPSSRPLRVGAVQTVRQTTTVARSPRYPIVRPHAGMSAAPHSSDNRGEATSTMARRPRPKAPPPHPLIEFFQPTPATGDRLIRVVVVLDTKSKRWGFYIAPQLVVVADDVGGAPDAPADLEYPFDDLTDAVHAALEVRASAGNQFRIVRDPGSGRWGYHEVSRAAHPAEDDILPDDVQFPFNTVAEATTGALRHLEPYWGDPSTALLIEGGVAVPGIPVNARIIGSPGYRATIDGGLYDLDQSELQAVHERTLRHSGEQARETTVKYDIPLGQQVHAFRELREKLWPRHRRKRGSYPKVNDWLDQMMPTVQKRTRERHFKTFAIVSSDDWPVILAITEIEITGMESILRAARAFSPPRSRRKKVRTPSRIAIRHYVRHC
jgi:hypothetical protein